MTLERPAILGTRFRDAVSYALDAHQTQVRKGSSIPYVSHLFGVCSLVLEHGGQEDDAIAALLHDVVEDQGGDPRLEDVERRFGARVAFLVKSCSDSFSEPKPPWRARKDAYIRHLETTDLAVLRISMADKLHNARAIVCDLRMVGDDLWRRFKGGREGSLWYYNALVKVFEKRVARDASTLQFIFESLRYVVGMMNDFSVRFQAGPEE